MTGLTTEVSVDQIASAVRNMDDEKLQELLRLAPEPAGSLPFVTTITYQPGENGYLAKCIPIDAVAWGEDPASAIEALLDAVIDIAVALVEYCPNPDEALRCRLPYAHSVYRRKSSRNEVRTLLGLPEDSIYLP